MKLLNIGCGTVFHPEWVNVDMVSTCPEVRAYDLRKGVPYPEASFDAVYSSHLLEHLKKTEAHHLLDEIYRVLKPEGIVRIVVPDLESIARSYLAALEKVKTKYSPIAEADYEWMMLELYDQAVRCKSGGEMGVFLSQQNISNKEFILSRVGFEAANYWAEKQGKNTPVWKKLFSGGFTKRIKQGRVALAKLAVALLAGKEAKVAFDEGIFRSSGEIHHWMYDSYSLCRMIDKAGFTDIKTCTANESQIPGFGDYHLDVINGKVRKPDSLFMEGKKGL